MTLPQHSTIAARESDFSALGPDCYCAFGHDSIAYRVGANAERILGIAAGELSGKSFLQRVHVPDRVVVAKAIGDCAAAGRETRAEFRLRSNAPAPDRAPTPWYEMRCVPIDSVEAPNHRLALAIVRDVSAEHDLKQQLLAAREQVEGISAHKARFLANMSHELRTPLNAILGFSELLQSEVMRALPRERHQEYIGLIHSSARHLLQVVNDILDMSKMDAGKYEIMREPFDLAQVLRECCAMVRTQAQQKGLVLSTGGFDDLPELCADARAIKQIVINLLSNAVKFTASPGRVEVAARRTGSSVEIEVRDEGIGISEEHLAKLGTPFYQADSKYDRKYEGTGLGLSLVFGLAELHGGTVSVASKRNAGTRVTVKLPIDAARCKPVPAVEDLHVVQAGGDPDAFQQKSAGRGAKA